MSFKVGITNRFIYRHAYGIVIRMQDAVIRRAFGQKLRQCRKRKGVTQEKLAQQCKLNRVSITNMESGRQSLSLPALYAIAYALDVDVHELLPSWPELEELRLSESRVPKSALNRADVLDWVERVTNTPE